MSESGRTCEQLEGEPSAPFPPARFWVAVVCSVLSIVGVVAGLGFPENAQAFIWIVSIVILNVAILVDRFWLISWGLLAVVCLLVVIGCESDYLVDIQGGRQGVEIRPGPFRFARSGPNTQLLEEHLGPSEAVWMSANIRHILFATWRGGSDHFHSRSMIFRDYLPKILDLLPHREARIQILACSTNPNNANKLHQEMLLVALLELGYPQGYDAQSWWERHKSLFVVGRDLGPTPLMVGGWLGKMEECISDKTWNLRFHLRAARKNHFFNDVVVVEKLLDSRDAGEGIDVKNIELLTGKCELPAFGVDQVAWWSSKK